ncbi:MAG: acyl-ACP--UDP-N-acetylglucosamine O-acyltransferase [Variibacter sp.]
MARIHPLAHVESGARIADDAEIGPFCVIGPHVEIGPGCRLIAHVHVAGHTKLGARSIVHPYVSLGGPPQSQSYHGEPTRLEIGEACDLREGVTMNIGTVAGGGLTKVGARGFYMANAHVGHDCIVGDDVVFANSATLGGHCEIGDQVFIGGLSAVHQWTRIGSQAMIGGVSGVRGDVIPFGLASGDQARMMGINVVGMKRRKFERGTIAAARQAYREIFFGTASLDDRLHVTEEKFSGEPVVAAIIAFIRSREHRSLCRPTGTDTRA